MRNVTGGIAALEDFTSEPLSAQRVRQLAYSMPIHAPSYARGPIWFFDRPALTVTYRTDIDLARAIVPEPLEVIDPLVSLTFLHMAGQAIGDYYEFAQGIACHYRGERLSFRPLMIAENVTAILSGREVLGMPKKHGQPFVGQRGSSYVGQLEVDGDLVARASMAYKFAEWDRDEAARALEIPGVVLKIVPDRAGECAAAELVKFTYSDLVVKQAWSGPGSVELFHHHVAPIAMLPVREMVSVRHTLCDCRLQPGEAIFDYLTATSADEATKT